MITKCRECGKDVSDKVERCPHCGINNPAGKGFVERNIGKLIFWGIILVFVGAPITCTTLMPDKKHEKEVEQVATPEKSFEEPVESIEKKPKEKSLAECRKDLKCWAKKYEIEANVACRFEVEKQINYAFEWKDGMFKGMAFMPADWVNKEKGTILFVGDKLMIQNEYGAWRKYVYACAYNPDIEKALVLELRPKDH